MTLAHVSAPEVQQFLEQTKLNISDVDTELEKTATELVFSSVSKVYDVTTWTDPATTPRLIRKVIAMLVAAWSYARQYSEDTADSTNSYADALEKRALGLIDSIVSGIIDLLDVVGTVGSESGPAYFPDDTTGHVQAYDARGFQVGLDQYSEDIKFRMGSVF